MRAPRVLSIMVAVGLVFAASPGWAEPRTIPFVDQGPGGTADRYPRLCDPALGGGPYPDVHIWILTLPEGGGEFIGAGVNFGSASGPRYSPAHVVSGGQAWAAAFYPWGGIVFGLASVEGTAESFFVKGTCPASGPIPSATPTGPGSTLPKTGAAPLKATAIGGAAVAAGVALLLIYRRRRPV